MRAGFGGPRRARPPQPDETKWRLLIFAHLHLHKGSVLLIDEPDAHLEILRQQQVYVLLRDIAGKNGCQVVLVTHSEVLLREALDTNLSLILHGRSEDLADKEAIRASLKHFGAAGLWGQTWTFDNLARQHGSPDRR